MRKFELLESIVIRVKMQLKDVLDTETPMMTLEETIVVVRYRTEKSHGSLQKTTRLLVPGSTVATAPEDGRRAILRLRKVISTLPEPPLQNSTPHNLNLPTHPSVPQNLPLDQNTYIIKVAAKCTAA